jgi:NAD(P)H-dependent flavin oxidoreductase YrpB (nitropropane dioxygenase family)
VRTSSRSIPQQHNDFVRGLTERFGIRPPRDAAQYSPSGDNLIPTHRRAHEKWDVAKVHTPALVASALGPAPAQVVEEVHAYGGLVTGLLGAPGQATVHVNQGADVVVAQGAEAGGHTGHIGTMVLVPQIVDEVRGTPVLAAGGIGDGRQIAAALALGAQGVWTGSLWLPTIESDLEEPVKRKLLAARSRDAVKSRCMTGKSIRMLRTPWVEAWESEDAPSPLPAPLQGLLVREAMAGIFEHNVEEVMGTAVGQVVGMLDEMRSVREVMYELVEECIEAMTALNTLQDVDS